MSRAGSNPSPPSLLIRSFVSVSQMVEGRLSKFYEESCLLEQKYLMDDSLKVKGAVDK
jgi:translation elongation factor EF-Ts